MIDDGLRKILREYLPMPLWHWQAIESGGIGVGTPDASYCRDGCGEGWVECKATTGWSPEFRPAQPAWIHTRARMGARVTVATRRRHEGGPRKGPPVDELWLHDGRDVLALAEGGLKAAPALLTTGGGPRAWDWAAVAAALLR